VFCLNLGQDAVYSDCAFSWFFSVSPEKIPGWYLDYVTTTSFQILFGSSFIYYPAIQTPPNSANVKNTWIYTSTPPYAFMA
jgi:hypothetical protein